MHRIINDIIEFDRRLRENGDQPAEYTEKPHLDHDAAEYHRHLCWRLIIGVRLPCMKWENGHLDGKSYKE